MPSPDVTPYLDLVISDKSEQDIFDGAVQRMRIAVPEWTPRETNIEVLLLEAMSMQVAELVYAINRLPDSVVETLLKLYGIERDPGQQPQTDLTFYMAGGAGYTIPAGVKVVLSLSGGLEPVSFTTTETLVIPPGETTGRINGVLGDRYTSEANGIAEGSTVELIDSVVYVDRVELAYTVYNGRDAETDDAYFVRAIQRLDRITETLVTPKHFEALALEEPYVQRVIAIDNYDPTTPNGNPGQDKGHLALGVYGAFSPLSDGEKSALLANINSKKLAILDVHLIDPVVTVIDVTASIYVLSGYDSGTVIDNVKTAIRNYLSPQTWEWSTRVRTNALISLIASVKGVDYVNTMFVPANDVELRAIAPLVQAGNIVITEA